MSSPPAPTVACPTTPSKKSRSRSRHRASDGYAFSPVNTISPGRTHLPAACSPSRARLLPTRSRLLSPQALRARTQSPIFKQSRSGMLTSPAKNRRSIDELIEAELQAHNIHVRRTPPKAFRTLFADVPHGDHDHDDDDDAEDGESLVDQYEPSRRCKRPTLPELHLPSLGKRLRPAVNDAEDSPERRSKKDNTSRQKDNDSLGSAEHVNASADAEIDEDRAAGGMAARSGCSEDVQPKPSAISHHAEPQTTLSSKENSSSNRKRKPDNYTSPMSDTKKIRLPHSKELSPASKDVPDLLIRRSSGHCD